MSKHQTARSVFGFVCLLLLVTQALTQETMKVTDQFTSHQDTVAKEKHIILELSEAQITDIESKEKFLYITLEALEGDGLWTISGKDPRQDENQGILKKIEAAFVHKTPEVTGISTESEIWEEVKLGKKLYITVKNTGQEENPLKLNYVGEVTQHIDIAAGAYHKIHTKNLTTLTIKSEITKADGNHHYKFMIDALQHAQSAIISAEISRFTAEGTKGNTKNFLKFEQDKIGFVVNPEDTDMYCPDVSCFYLITVALKDVRSINYYVGQHIDFELLSEGITTVRLFDIDRLHQRHL